MRSSVFDAWIASCQIIHFFLLNLTFLFKEFTIEMYEDFVIWYFDFVPSCYFESNKTFVSYLGTWTRWTPFQLIYNDGLYKSFLLPPSFKTNLSWEFLAPYFVNLSWLPDHIFPWSRPSGFCLYVNSF